MNGTQRLATDRKISTLVDRLQLETSPESKDMLRRLMIREEDRFASRQEKLQLIDKWIMECDTRIAQVYKYVSAFPADSETAGLTRLTLTNLSDLAGFLAKYRDIVQAADRH